jgi:hypothetical protein
LARQVALFDERKQSSLYRPNDAGAARGKNTAWGQTLIRVVEALQRKSKLLQIILALNAAGSFACGLNGRKEKSDENPNDG